MNKMLLTVSVVLASMAIAPVAEARRSQREGFNFGTSVRMLNTDDRANADLAAGTKNVRQSSTSQSVSPYLGWVFGDALNLGVMGVMETATSDRREQSLDGQSTYARYQKSYIRGASVFGRFLFANVLFFEGGFGVYEQNISVREEKRDVTGSDLFVGETGEYGVKGSGLGYHVGGGIELPIVDGFHFTTTYLIRVFQIRDVNGDAVSAKKGQQERRELSFGLSYYYQ